MKAKGRSHQLDPEHTYPTTCCGVRVLEIVDQDPTCENCRIVLGKQKRAEVQDEKAKAKKLEKERKILLAATYKL